MKTQHIEGHSYLVEIWNSKNKCSDLIPCEINKITGAIDRDYRINLTTADGRQFEGCAPECVISKI